MMAAPAPTIRVARPGADLEAMRSAYLDLLKLALCDLAGAGTISVGRLESGRAYSRELGADQLHIRATGMDWPLNGLTMTGLARLNDLQGCVESVVRDGVEGDLIEAGAWRGGATILMRATLDSLGEDERKVWVADSFEGFPLTGSNGADEDREGEDLVLFDFLAVPLADVQRHFARFGVEHGVEFVPGFFEHTIPPLRGRRWSVIRLDGDTYEATRVNLDSLYPGLAAGGYLIVDDYGALEQCRRAVDDFRAEHGITEPLEQVDWTCMRWRRESDPAEVAHSAAPSAGQLPAPVRSAPREPGARIPTGAELELEGELEALGARLDAAEAELERLRASPLAGPAAWARRRASGLRGGAK